MSTSSVTKVSLEQKIRNLVAGTQKHLPTGSLTLGGTTYSEQALVQLLQSLADSLASEATANAAWKDALKNVDSTKVKVIPVMESYRSWVLATYGSTPSTLADYGVSPRKVPTPLTAEQKATAALKRAATRKARQTLGKNQKKSIKGTVSTTAAGTNTATAQTSIAAPATATPPVKAAS